MAVSCPYSEITDSVPPDVSVPSLAMIGYAGVYLPIAFSLAIYHFHQRDL
jgi:hypothetical protein